MRNSSFEILNGDDSDDIVGAAIDSGQFFAASFQYIFGDTDAAGTIFIEGSNDPCPNGTGGAFEPSNWNSVVDSAGNAAEIAITAGGTGVLMIAPFCYRFLRARWEQSTPGTSDLIININVQGV